MASGSVFDVIVRRWYIVLIVAVAAVVGAWLVWQRLPPRYTASTTLRVGAAPGTDIPYRLDYADRFANSLATLAESDWMSRQLTTRVGTPPNTRIVAELPANTDLMILSVTLASPTLAAAAANEAGRLIVDLSNDGSIEAGAGAPDTLLLRQFDPAHPPTEVTGPGLPLIMALAALLGLVAGSALAALTVPGRQPSYVTSPPPANTPHL